MFLLKRKRVVSFFSSLILLAFGLTSAVPAQAQLATGHITLPAAGQMVYGSYAVKPAVIKGVNIDPANPFSFDFIIDRGDRGLTDTEFEQESEKLIKYFLTALTVPQDQMWVNLSPYEADRIVPDAFGQTEMGRDLLAQDYILKQFTASLLYPEDELGEAFWKRVQEKAARAGITDLPYNTFNKVWIVPEKAVVYEHANGAFVVDSHLKVMLDDDYIALEANRDSTRHGLGDVNASELKPLTGVTAESVREVVLPEIEYEVNNGELFANLRQIYDAVILANWYKQSLKESVLGRSFVDQERTAGARTDDPDINQKIYDHYVQAFEQGVYDYIKDEYDPNSQNLVQRKYVSGGADFAMLNDGIAQTVTGRQLSIADALTSVVEPERVRVALNSISVEFPDSAMLGTTPELGIEPQELRAEILKEIAEPGTGKIPSIFTISDQHGTIDRFDELLLHMFQSVAPADSGIQTLTAIDHARPLEEQFNEVGVSLSDFQGEMFIHNIGDFMDRGPFGVRVYRRSKELIDAGLSDFIVGNHDQWMFMNLTAFHLPWYDNFEFYGYRDDYDRRFGNVKLLVEQSHKENPQETRDRTWWAEKLAEFMEFHNGQQKSKWTTVDKEVNSEGGLFSVITEGMDKDDIRDWFDTDEGKVWAKLKGFDPNVGDVYTGVRAVGLVSIVWWQELLKDFKSVMAQSETIESGSAKEQAWESAINMIENHIIRDLKKELEQRLSSGQWYWRVFEAINSQNYTSAEWWAKDWVYHKGWGSSVLEEINNELPEGAEKVTPANYLNNPTLQEIAVFYKEQYRLHVRDVMQTDYMHAFLPVDDRTGEFYFNYKGRRYKGKGNGNTAPYWEGLHRIAEDVRSAPSDLNDPQLIPAIYEAMSVVNEWYADTTTTAKVSHVANALNAVGLRKTARANGINRLMMGHTPLHDFWKKLTEDKRGRIKSFREGTDNGHRQFIFTDHGMGQKFGGGGKYVVQDGRSLRLVGYSSKEATSIEDSPETIIFDKDGSPVSIFNNPEIGKELFLKTVGGNIAVELGLDPITGEADNAMLVSGQLKPEQTFPFYVQPNASERVHLNDRQFMFTRVNDGSIWVSPGDEVPAEAIEESRIQPGEIYLAYRLFDQDSGLFDEFYGLVEAEGVSTMVESINDEWGEDVDFLVMITNFDSERVQITNMGVEGLAVDNADSAMIGSEPVGGIDLNAAMIEMDIQGDGENFDMPALDRLPAVEVDGFIPVILEISPIINLPLLIGLEDGSENSEKVTYYRQDRWQEHTAHLN